MGASKKVWLPLESNPDVMNKFARAMNVPAAYSFADVYGTDEELLGMVPQPVVAVLLLFPVSAKSEEARHLQEEDRKSRGDTAPSGVFFTKQTIGNACGTIALLHAFANLSRKDPSLQNTWFGRFAESSADSPPEKRAAALEQDDELEQVHEEVSHEGQTAPPSVDEPVELHFICFMSIGDVLYELDGRKSGPIAHGKCTEADLLQQAVRVIKTEFMDVDPDSINFGITALVRESSQ